MSLVGKVESLWRYPVKSMRGEELQEAFVGFSGVYGDRLFAFKSSAAPKGFPYLTGREQEEMLLYRPRFRHPERAAKPPNLSEAEGMAPGINPVFADAVDLAVDVEAPSRQAFGVDDPALMSLLAKNGRWSCPYLAAIRARDDALSSNFTVFDSNRPPAWRRNRNGPRQATVQSEYLYGSRVYRRVRGGLVCRPNLADRAQGGDFSPRARSALQDDHNRSRYGSA